MMDEESAAEEDASSDASSTEDASSRANVYYALAPNPPDGGCRNELRFSLCDGAGVSFLDVGRGNIGLEDDDDPGVNASSSSVAGGGGQLMFGTTRFGEAPRAFDAPEARLAHLAEAFATAAARAPRGGGDGPARRRADDAVRARGGEPVDGRCALLGDARTAAPRRTRHQHRVRRRRGAAECPAGPGGALENGRGREGTEGGGRREEGVSGDGVGVGGGGGVASPDRSDVSAAPRGTSGGGRRRRGRCRRRRG